MIIKQNKKNAPTLRQQDKDVDYITLGLHSTVFNQKYCTIAARKNQGAAFLRPFLGGTIKNEQTERQWNWNGLQA